MENITTTSVLIIGGPNAGKTHFGGQLYGRLNSRRFNYKIDPNNRPADLSIFQDVLDKLSEGKRANHTESNANRTIELKIEDPNGNKIVFAFPDYGGEQINFIIDKRKINEIWRKYIESSNSWVLFIRLDEVQPIEDIINRGIPDPEVLRKRQEQNPPVRLSDTAYFVELIQMLLHVKRCSTLDKIKKPNLTVILSCWDLLELPENTIPSEILKDKLPLLYNFFKNTWSEESFNVLGLSSTEKTLTDDADEEYLDKTPVDFGYIIDSEGNNDKDLTSSIKTIVGK